ncbi:MAG TPA: hypothetical protein VJJ46_09685 [Anaerolineales bacterium]|nr:hypothetical protein [Anaerolineales bacterium]
MAGWSEEAERLGEIARGPEPEELGAGEAEAAGRLLDSEEELMLL